eukprot:Clim_evm62s128 gene=Clim_evmTU62s128
MSEDKKKIVVVGGNYGALRALHGLGDLFDVTVIEPKEYIEVTPGTIHALFQPTEEDVVKAQKKISAPVTEFDMYQKAKHVEHDFVKEITAEEVVTLGGKSFKYDYVIINSGSTVSGPWKTKKSGGKITLEDRIEELKAEYKEYTAAKSFCVIGTGVTGTEISGEIAERRPDSEVHVVTGRAGVLPGMKEKLRKEGEETLKAFKNVVLHKNMRGTVEDSDSTGPVTVKISDDEKEESITVDKVYVATGIKPNTSFAKNDFLQESLDDKGYLKVNQFFQVGGHENIFAVGDCASVEGVKDPKMMKLAVDHGNMLNSILSSLAKKGKLPSKGWHGEDWSAMLVSIGPSQGVGHIRFINFTGWWGHGSSLMMRIKLGFLGSTISRLKG